MFVECKLTAGNSFMIPATIEERAVHVLQGEVTVDKVHYGDARMLILQPGQPVKITAVTDARIILLGGTALEEPRYLWWNFVASSKERIEQAKLDWKEGKFGKIPGDDQEFIPLPE